MEQRLNIYQNGKIIGQDYQRENGDWMHKWWCRRDNRFERGSWPGRAQGDNMSGWAYLDAALGHVEPGTEINFATKIITI